MKKERNCSGGMNNMPVYGVSMPMMMPPQPPTMMYSNPSYSAMPNYSSTPSYSQNTVTTAYNNVEQQMNNMQQQINMLDSRVSKLEGKANQTITNKYSDSNYYML